MSFIIGADIFIESGQAHAWTGTWFAAGWQGNTFFQDEPLNTNASLTFTAGAVRRNSNGAYSFDYLIRNNGPNSTLYNIQASNI